MIKNEDSSNDNKLPNVMRNEMAITLLALLADSSGIPVARLKSKPNKREIVFVRQQFYYLCKINKICSLRISASYFDQDHATALYGYNTICDLMDTDKAICQEMKTLDRIAKERVLNLKLFTWIEDKVANVEDMYYKGKLVGHYNLATKQYKIVCQPYLSIPSEMQHDCKAFIENEFLKYLDCII